MRIWIVNHTALPPAEPGGTRHYSLARELGHRGHDVLVIASTFHYVTRRPLRLADGGTYTRENVEGVPFLWLRTPPYRESRLARAWSWLVFSWRVWRQVGSQDLDSPDVILGSSPYPFAALAAERVATRNGAPFVLEIRDLWPQTLIDLGEYSALHPFIVLLGWIERYLYHRADRIISLLPEADDYMVGRGADPDRIEWIPNGVDLEMVPQPARPSGEGPFTVMYAGAHGLSNTLDLVLDTAGVLLRVGSGADRIVIRLVGDGPYKPRLMERARREGLENVVFEDPVPKQEVYGVLQEADAFVRPLEDSPLYRWGASPNKLFDYMACARPVVYATKSSANPVDESGAGITVPPDDPEAMAAAFRKLSSLSIGERWEIGLRGRRFVEQHHAFSRLAEALEGVLEGATAEGR